jgi:16S rRNA G527 N7-methylase RsmG
LTVLQHLSLEVVVQLSPASVWVSGVIVHLTSNGIYTSGALASHSIISAICDNFLKVRGLFLRMKILHGPREKPHEYT